MHRDLKILGIESSCDDTAAAIVRSAPGERPDILSSYVIGQTELHKDFGGVVPEIAARAHAEKLDIAAKRALDEAGTKLSEIDAIAVTAGPGLIGGVLSGVMFAKGLGAGANIPVIGVNHLAGHALTPRLTDAVQFPYLMLLVSGGHCQFLIVKSAQEFIRIGGTIDDAPGEAFDKTAKLLGLGQPGGPQIEKHAKSGDPARFAFPRPLLKRDTLELSFSGLKTAVLRCRDAQIAEHGGLHVQTRADICASFQQAVRDILAAKSKRAFEVFQQTIGHPPTAFAVAGGVAANAAIRSSLADLSESQGCNFVAPPLALCTDNAAMIAWVGVELMRVGSMGEVPVVARPRWPLDQRSPSMLGSGKKGAKA
jgi:N6-L-threonylcarbamoyladenine synthase